MTVVSCIYCIENEERIRERLHSRLTCIALEPGLVLLKQQGSVRGQHGIRWVDAPDFANVIGELQRSLFSNDPMEFVLVL